ncbi:MAG: response regulator, partial [Elusimicrobia bacterium]|nr:response regulator [Elusimicrobiota bacterium]
MTPSKREEKILIVDDEEAIRNVCSRTLRASEFRVETAENGEKALLLLPAGNFDLVFTDLAMPGAVNGLRLFEEIKRQYPCIDVVIMTAYPALETAIPTLKNGAYDYLIKPFEQELLKSVVGRCFEKRRLSQQLNKEKILREILQVAYSALKRFEEFSPEVQAGNKNISVRVSDPQVLSLLKASLEKSQYRMQNGQDARRPDAVILDENLIPSLEASTASPIPVVLITEKMRLPMENFVRLPEGYE